MICSEAILFQEMCKLGLIWCLMTRSSTATWSNTIYYCFTASLNCTTFSHSMRCCTRLGYYLIVMQKVKPSTFLCWITCLLIQQLHTMCRRVVLLIISMLRRSIISREMGGQIQFLGCWRLSNIAFIICWIILLKTMWLYSMVLTSTLW